MINEDDELKVKWETSDCSEEVKLKYAERYYKRIKWEISDFYEVHKVKPNYIILGESVHESLVYAKILNTEEKIFDIPFHVQKDGIGFQIGHMRKISF